MTSQIPFPQRWVIICLFGAMLALMAAGEYQAGAWMTVALVVFAVSVIYFRSE